MPANHFVARASLASSVFDLFFDRNVSELPLSAPESPEVFPDWRTTIATIAMQIIRWTMTTAVFMLIFNPFKISNRQQAVNSVRFFVNCNNSTCKSHLQAFFTRFYVAEMALQQRHMKSGVLPLHFCDSTL